MRKKLTGILGALALGWFSLPASAQVPPPQVMPAAQQIPQPIQGNQPQESPPPTTNGVFPAVVVPGPVPQSGEACCNNNNIANNDQHHSFWSGTWSVGGGAYYLFPFFSSNPAYFTTTTPGGRTTNSQHDFNNQGNGAPLAFLSYTFENGIGIQGRWFRYEGSTSTSGNLDGNTGISDGSGNSLGTPGAGSHIDVNSQLKLNVIDLELTQKWVFGCWWLQATGGVRYAYIYEGYQMNVTDPVNGNASSSSSHTFNGFGPTISFEVHRRLWDSAFGVYGSARGSLLFGTLSENFQITSPLVANAAGSNNSTSIIPVGEVEMGGEWSHCWGRVRIFGQLGVVGQIWGNAGNASTGGTLATGSLGNQSTSAANFGFIGGVGRLGIDF